MGRHSSRRSPNPIVSFIDAVSADTADDYRQQQYNHTSIAIVPTAISIRIPHADLPYHEGLTKRSGTQDEGDVVRPKNFFDRPNIGRMLNTSVSGFRTGP